MIRAHQVVTGSLASGVRAVWLVRVGFGERRGVGSQRAIHFVGRNVQKAQCTTRQLIQAAPVSAHGLQQVEGADHVGFNKGLRAVDRAVDVGLGGKVDDGTWLMGVQ
ncbi:hypothetical protein D3C79_996350 [compost metagenome]